jgi:tRNA threonylcarbamoyladenosine biosynthesis protein TsaE
VIEVKDETQMNEFAGRLAGLLRGGEIIELVGDVGAGKTTFTRGLATALGVEETVQSPSFTINRMYDAAKGLRLAHYDFYRLQDAGIMADELADTLNDDKTIVVIEWSDTVKGALPTDRLAIHIETTGEESRKIILESGGDASAKLKEKLQ